MKRLADLRFERFPFAFPAVTKPVWSGKVDRWYQLDATAYGLAQACFQWRQVELEQPSFMVLASRGASNDADRAFVESGAASPAKFVHTLPSVRGSIVCQIMDWHGPMLCLQEDPSTLCVALVEAVKIVCEAVPVVWVLSTWREGSVFSVMRLIVTNHPSPGAGIQVTEEDISAVRGDTLRQDVVGGDTLRQDVPMLTWLEDSSMHYAPFSLFEGLKLLRRPDPYEKIALTNEARLRILPTRKARANQQLSINWKAPQTFLLRGKDGAQAPNKSAWTEKYA